MKGILLAGGSGTRLYPMTRALSKQLLPVYDKPTIYYPLSTLMMAGIREIVIISTPRDLPMIESLLGDGRSFGISIVYLAQPKPEGIAQALVLAEPFLNGSSSCLILGDNLFYGHDLADRLTRSTRLSSGGTIYGYRVGDPERYGVVDFSEDGRALSIEEKPKNPRSSWAVTGLYFYDNSASRRARQLKPSPRGELEITDINMSYLKDGLLNVEQLGRGYAWLDTGTPESLLSSSIFVQTIEDRQGLKICCPEEIAFEKGWISTSEMATHVEANAKSGYGMYLARVLKERA